MKINRVILPIMLFAASAGLFQACYMDEEELFNTTSSARMQQALKEAREMLQSSADGWVLEMYPEATQMYGGWSYTVRFDEAKVYARSEMYDTGKEVSSTYKMTNDDGPVLIFDGYNELLHEFSTATSNDYQAKKGEFEFIVMKLEHDRITLRGKKTANTCYMYRLTEDAQSYLDKVKANSDRLLLEGIKGEINGQQVVAKADLNNRQLTFSANDELVKTVAFCLTDKGLRTYEPVEIAGASISDFTVTFENDVPTDFVCGSVSLKSFMAEGWVRFSAYAGKYLFYSYENSSAAAPSATEIELVADPNGVNYWLKGLIPNVDLRMDYNKALGTLDLRAQVFVERDDHSKFIEEKSGGKTYYYGMCPFSLVQGASSGSINYNTAIGLRTQWNGDEASPVFNLIDNGEWSGNKARCLRIYGFTSSTMSSTARDTGKSIANDLRFNVGQYASTTLYWPERMEKVND